MKKGILITATFATALLFLAGISFVAVEASATVTKVRWDGSGVVDVK